DYIDKYSIRQAVEDGVTVEIIYEGRTHSATVTDREAMNKRFEDVFAAASDESRQKVLGRYTWKAYLEAEETIRDKAEDMQKHDAAIASFKLPFGRKADDGTTGDVGIIIVQSMLLTGFDAPVEQVMYMDDLIREHNLLQAIARVNRVDKNKFAGFIVDYVGVTKHLREALANFEDKDLEEVMKAIKDESRDLDELVYAK